MDKVSIISVTYRSLEDTRQFVESVLAMTNDPYEFIMVANGVTDPSLQDFLRKHEAKNHLKLLWNPTNIGVRAFGQAMRLASHDYIFRCDSDIKINDPYWTRRMVAQHQESSKLFPVAAVGTANTRGFQIRRSETTIETDMIMSNCMTIHKPTVAKISEKLVSQYPHMQQTVSELKENHESYPGFFSDLDATLEFARLGGWWWDTNFGGKDEVLGYGSDDMWWSILARWADLRLVTSATLVEHHDASARPGYEAERHRLVSRGFQYMRTSLSLIMGVWDQKYWQGLPNNLPVLVDYRNSAQKLTKSV